MQPFRELEQRTLDFTKKVIQLCRKAPRDSVTQELTKQLVRSSASIGANYREANEKLGVKDFIHRIRIARKEAKETSYWLELIEESLPEEKKLIADLYDESLQLRKIFTAIIEKSCP